MMFIALTPYIQLWHAEVLKGSPADPFVIYSIVAMRSRRRRFRGSSTSRAAS